MTPLARALLGAGLCLLASACATGTAPAPDARTATAIDLEPRCFALPAAPPVAIAAARATLEPWPALAERGVRAWRLATPGSPHDALSLGFRFDPRRSTRFDRALVAAWLREAATTPDPQRFRRRVAATGGTLQVDVERDRLWLTMRFAPDRRAAALALFERWLDARPPSPADADRLRRSTRLASLAEDASAAAVAERVFARLGQGDPPGPAADLEADALGPWLRDTLRAADATILYSYAGSRPEAATSAALSRFIAARPPSGEATPGDRAAATRPVVAADTLHVVDRPGSPQVEIRVGYATVPPDHPDAAALEQLASLLGADVGGRLFRDLRERQGLVYTIDAEHTPAGAFVVSTRARPERVGALLLGIEAHLRALVDVPIRACEHAMLQARAFGEQALEADDPQARRAALRADVGVFGRARPLDERRARVAAVALADLGAAARRHLDRTPLVVLVGDAAALRPALAATLPERALRRVAAD